ncbi:MAG: hypothetical protein HZA24_00395 [Nitrospirae bacterium]|nr:hypothetical protein [Nitrospirota bacterium]
MANHVGSEGTVKVGTNTVAEIKSWSLDIQGEVIEDTELNDAWKTHKPGIKSWSGAVECHWDETDATGQGAMVVGSEVTLALYPEGATSGDAYFSGQAIFTGKSLGGENNGIVSAGFKFTGNGILNESTVV